MSAYLTDKLDASLYERLSVEVRVVVIFREGVNVEAHAEYLKARGWHIGYVLENHRAVSAVAPLHDIVEVGSWSQVEGLEEPQPVSFAINTSHADEHPHDSNTQHLSTCTAYHRTGRCPHGPASREG